jgi:CRP/FNR family nitrogen fixation transcriptional regulator
MSYSGQTIRMDVARPLSGFPVAQPAVVPNLRVVRADTQSDALSALDPLGSLCRFSKNETIFEQGEELQSSYKIVSGAVRLCRLTADGRRQIAEFRVSGDFIAFEWDGEYTLTAEAVRDVVAIRYVRTRVDRVIEQRSDVRERVFAMVRQDLRAAQDHLITLGCQTAKERVASFLLHLAKRGGAKDGEVIDMQLGRQDIADYLGLTLETISRTFTELQRKGIIALPKRRQVVIRNTPRLLAQTAGVN